MFEWLEQEILAIKTPRFHVVDGPAAAKLREAILQSNLPLPPSYREFVVKFGNAKLYRMAGSDSYRIGVFAGPREATLADGTRIYHLGFHDGASVYVSLFITPALPGESTASVQTTVNNVPVGAQVVQLAASSMATVRTIVLAHSERPDFETQGRGIPNYLGAMALSRYDFWPADNRPVRVVPQPFRPELLIRLASFAARAD